MGLLQFKTSQISSMDQDDKLKDGADMKQDAACQFEVNTGEECKEPKEWGSYWCVFSALLSKSTYSTNGLPFIRP